MSKKIDYLAFTTTTVGLERVQAWALRWFGSLEISGGLLGYASTLRAPGLTVCYNGGRGMGIHVQVSGVGCDAVKACDRWEGWSAFLGEIDRLEATPKRLDIAFDDTIGTLSVDEMVHAIQKECMASRYSSWSYRRGYNRKSLQANVLYIGSVSSPSCVCVYDKRVEQLAGGNDDPGHWVRVEVRFKGDQAAGAWEWLRSHEELEEAEEVLGSMVSFRVESLDSVVSRREVAPWWNEFLQTSIRNSIAPVAKLTTLVKRLNAFLRQHATTFVLLQMAVDHFRGAGGFLREVVEVGSQRLTERHLNTLAGMLNADAREVLLPAIT